ncbi:MAG: hypothetical protein KC457_08950, partial [Myxococcales bacterium]|nr:hypothetical protein [Myxococcales bacterium]
MILGAPEEAPAKPATPPIEPERVEIAIPSPDHGEVDDHDSTPPAEVTTVDAEQDAALESPQPSPSTPPESPVAVVLDERDDDPTDGDATDLGEPDDGKKKKKKKKLQIEPRARVVFGGTLSSKEAARDLDGNEIGLPQRKAGFELRQARVGLRLDYREVLRVKITADLADFLDSPDAGKVVRDAWANITIHRAFQIKVGNFKRPFSRLELRGFSSIPFIGRGLFNSWAVEDLGWGDRHVGVQMWGKIDGEGRGLHEFTWALSASSDVTSGGPNGVDTHARVTYDPLAWMSIGANAAYKHVQDPLADENACRDDWRRDPGCRRDVFAAGGDLRFLVGKKLYASVEVNLAQNWRFADTSPWGVGALAYASYDIEVGKRTTLQPVAFAEYIDTNLTFK